VTDESSQSSSHDPAIRALPPASTLVYRCLEEHDGPIRIDTIVDWTYLPRRTAKDALTRLRDENLVAADQDIPNEPTAKRYRLNLEESGMVCQDCNERLEDGTDG